MGSSNFGELAPGHECSEVVTPLSELVVLFVRVLLWLSHHRWQLIGSENYWYSSPLLSWMSALLLHHQSLALEEELGVDVLVLWIEELAQTALLTDDESWCFLAALVSAVEVAPCLLVVEDFEDLPEPVKKLGLASVGCSIDQDAVGFVLLVEYQVLDYVLDEVIVLGVLKDGFQVFCRWSLSINTLAVLVEILSDVWQFLLSLHIVIKML